jgi:hypothetical protein
VKLKDLFEAGNQYVEAGNCYMKVCNKGVCTRSGRELIFIREFADAAIAYELAAGLFKTVGRFELAAKMHKSIAEAMEADGKYEVALDHYTTARDMYLAQQRKRRGFEIVQSLWLTARCRVTVK